MDDPSEIRSRRLSPRQLEMFLTVVEGGSMAAAARHLGVAPGTIARAIHSLEARLQVRLFESGGQRRLTQHGEVAVQGARRALLYLDAVPREVHAVDALESGTLTVMTLPSLSEWVVSRAVSRFRVAHPNMIVRLTSPERPLLHYVSLAVESGLADLAVTELTYLPERLQVTELETQAVSGMLPPGTPVPSNGELDLDTFVNYGLVVGPYWEHSAAGRFIRRTCSDADSKTVVRTDYRDQVFHLVLAGVGVGIAHHDRAALARSLGAEVVRLTPAITRRVGVLTHPHRTTRAARAFETILHQMTRRH